MIERLMVGVCAFCFFGSIVALIWFYTYRVPQYEAHCQNRGMAYLHVGRDGYFCEGKDGALYRIRL